MKDFRIQVLKLAENVGDPLGYYEDTVDYVASELQVGFDEVKEVFAKYEPAD